MNGVWLKLLMIGVVGLIDLNGFSHFSDTEWSGHSLPDSVSGKVVQVAGVNNASGKGYLALICINGGTLEVRVSVGKYIGTPRNEHPLDWHVDSSQQRFAPASRLDYFYWSGDEALKRLDELSRGNLVEAKFSLWDRSSHSALFHLKGAASAIRRTLDACHR